jgi:hypothetical protein
MCAGTWVCAQLYARREGMLNKGDIDWALAEQLAFGALMLPFSPTASFGRVDRVSLKDTLAPAPDTSRSPNAAGVPDGSNGAKTPQSDRSSSHTQHADKVHPHDGGDGNEAVFEPPTLEAAAAAHRTLSETADALSRSIPDSLIGYVEHPTVAVRLSGQDSERGTFSQRHAVIYDQTTALPYCPLNGMSLGVQATFQVPSMLRPGRVPIKCCGSIQSLCENVRMACSIKPREYMSETCAQGCKSWTSGKSLDASCNKRNHA